MGMHQIRLGGACAKAAKDFGEAHPAFGPDLNVDPRANQGLGQFPSVEEHRTHFDLHAFRQGEQEVVGRDFGSSPEIPGQEVHHLERRAPFGSVVGHPMDTLRTRGHWRRSLGDAEEGEA